MKFGKLFLLFFGVFLTFSILVACGGGTAQTIPSEPTQENIQASTTLEIENQAGSEEGIESTVEVQPEKPGLPADVPIMENIRDFQATSNFSNMSFIVDMDVQDVVAWYQAELPKYEWEMSRAPDSAVGATANMSRINAHNDHLTLTLQHNPIGEFTVVRITVVRGQ